MKFRLSFVSNSSSSSFIIKKPMNEDPMIIIPDFCNMSLKNYISEDYYNDIDDTDDTEEDKINDKGPFGIRLNWKPESVNDIYLAVLECIKAHYFDSIIPASNNISAISNKQKFINDSVREITNFHKDIVDDNTLSYLDALYDHTIATYNFYAKLLYDFKTNYIDKHYNDIIDAIINYNGDVYKILGEINECWSYQRSLSYFIDLQMITNYNEFKEIYHKYPIHRASRELIDYANLLPELSSIYVKSFESYKLFLTIFLFYMVCMVKNEVLLELELSPDGCTDSSLDDIVYKIYSKCQFDKYANFQMLRGIER